MTQSKLTLEERLINYRISHKRYDDEVARLLAAGFTQQQADKIIIRKASKKTVESVLNKHDALLAEPYKLNHEQIAAIAANGGAQAMKVVITSFAQLKALGFDEAQIVAIAANGGAQAMKAVIASFAKLKALGCDEAQIVAIAVKGDVQAIKAILKCYSELISHGYSLERITKLAACKGGSKQIQKTNENKFTNPPSASSGKYAHL